MMTIFIVIVVAELLVCSPISTIFLLKDSALVDSESCQLYIQPSTNVSHVKHLTELVLLPLFEVGSD